jgi:hypothetical protein
VLVNGTPVISAPNAPRNTKVSATVSCAGGTVLLGGGGAVTTTATNQDRAVLVESRPQSAATWVVTAIVNGGALGVGRTMTVTAYALCSLP